MGRKCCVPHCYTGYATCKEKKASMFRVPEEQHLLDKWQEAIARADRPVTSKDNVCEKHFTENDIVRWRIVNGVNEEYKIPKLRSDAVPSIFPAQPEYIKKMVKKQRKLDDPNEPSIEHSSEPETSHIEMEIKIEPIEEEEHYNDLSLSETEIQIKTEIEDTEIKTEDETYKCKYQSDEINLYRCEQCPKFKTKWKNTYILHLNTKHNIRGAPHIYKCEKCDYTTKYYHNLFPHQTKHDTDETNIYRCELCPKFKTKWKNTYNIHLKTKHGIGGVTFYNCPSCTFVTKLKICLKRHLMKQHNIVEASAILGTFYKCDQCSFASSRKADLEKHVNNIHRERQKKILKKDLDIKYHCFFCNYNCFTRPALKHHVGSHIIGDNLKCLECDDLYVDRKLFVKHLLSHCDNLTVYKKKSESWN